MLFSGNLRLFAIHFLLYLPLVLVLQYRTGIYHSELSHHPDEPAHVVTSLMIHDYAKSGLGTSPLRFAENYYIHYPKVAFGIWPPIFHISAAVWMLLFTRTHTSLLVFIAFQCALCAATLAMFARRLFPAAVAFALGLFVIFMPAFQNASSLMMVDLFLTMMQLWAMMLLIAFFRAESMKTAIWFGIVTSLAMLTKGNANALLLCGVFMLLLTRQFSMLKRLPVYVAAAIIVLLGGPWQVVTLRFFKGTVPMDPLTVSRFWMLFTGYTGIFVERLGLLVFLIALVGLAATCGPLLLGRRKGPEDLDVAGAASLTVAIFLFHCIAPNPGPDDRYILPALPLLVLFAALGIRWTASALPAPRPSLAAKAAILTVLCLAWFLKNTFALTHRPQMGFAKITAALPAHVADEAVLVCSDAVGEGALITSMALSDPLGLEHIVLRGSKTLSESPWDPVLYHPFFSNATELETYLENVPVEAVVLDLSSIIWEQDRNLLAETIHDYPDKWMLALELPEGPDGHHLQLYKWIGPDHTNMRKNIRLRMRLTLGHDLQLK